MYASTRLPRAYSAVKDALRGLRDNIIQMQELLDETDKNVSIKQKK
jgi:Sec-independent protein translocase protein TatA